MTFDPTTPSAELPQPPRDPWPTTPQEALLAPDADTEDDSLEGDPDVAEDAAEDVQEVRAVAPENPKRIGRTIAKELDKRVTVMQQRQASFEELLRQLGVVDPSQPAAGLRGMYVSALAVSKEIDEKLARLKGLTNEVLQTLEAL